MSIMDITSLRHTKCNCKCHIVFAPECSRIVFYESNRENIVSVERSGYHKGGSVFELCTYVNTDTP